MRLLISLATLLLVSAVFWSQGAPTGGSTLLAAGVAACIVEAMCVRLPHYGTVSFGLVIYVPMIASPALGASSALADAAVALMLRELVNYTSIKRLFDEVLLDLLPLSVACLAPLLFRPSDPVLLLWLATGLIYISIRHMAVQALRSGLPPAEADQVKRLQAATASLRWGTLGLALVSIPLSQTFPLLEIAVLPILYSMRKSAIHAYAYLDKEDKKVLRKSLKGAETQLVEMARSLETTEVERNLLFDLSKDTVRCASLRDLLSLIESKTRSLKLGQNVDLLLQDQRDWLYLRFDEGGKPLVGRVNPSDLDSGFRDCWKFGSPQIQGRARAFHPLPGIGVLSLQAAPSKNAQAQEQFMSLFCSQVALACASAYRFEVLGRTLDELAQANTNLGIGNESLRVAMEKLQASEAKLIEGAKLAAIGQLSAGLAHEINNPLGSIRLGIEVTLRKEELSPLSRDMLEKGLKGVKRAETIIGSLLTYSRSGSKGRVPVNAWDVLFDTCSFLNASLRIQGITVKVPERGPEVRVLANPQELQQILTNLLLNARDAVEGRDPAIVQLRAGVGPNGEFRVEVHDSGEGIPANILGQIFDPFFTTKPVGKGTGLGLSVSREMTAAQDGQLEAGASDLLGGACFRLTLPPHPAKS